MKEHIEYLSTLITKIVTGNWYWEINRCYAIKYEPTKKELQLIWCFSKKRSVWVVFPNWTIEDNAYFAARAIAAIVYPSDIK